MDELIKQIDKYPNGEKLKIKYKDGSVLEGIIDTIYETNNELDEDDINYQEYYACAFLIVNVIYQPEEKYTKGHLIEINKFNSPCLILDNNDKIVWREEI